MDINVITLDNGKDYLIIDALEIESDRYLLLANEKDDRDLCVRKVVVEDGKEFLDVLDSEDEFDKVMTVFEEKHRGGKYDEK